MLAVLFEYFTETVDMSLSLRCIELSSPQRTGNRPAQQRMNNLPSLVKMEIKRA